MVLLKNWPCFHPELTKMNEIFKCLFGKRFSPFTFCFNSKFNNFSCLYTEEKETCCCAILYDNKKEILPRQRTT